MSPIGLGTVKFGRNQDVKYPQPFSLPSDLEIEHLLDHARELGINLLDTAPAYGSSEQRIGKLLRQRDDWIVCSKFGEVAAGKFDFTAATAISSVEQSLRHLQTDHLDLLLVHSDGNDVENLNDELLGALIRLKQSGKVKQVGASTKTVAGGLLTVAELDVAMVEYRPDDLSQQPVLDAAEKAGKGVLVKKALASGHATSSEQNLKQILAQQAVTSVIVGTLSPDHLQTNVKAALL